MVAGNNIKIEALKSEFEKVMELLCILHAKNFEQYLTKVASASDFASLVRDLKEKVG